MNDIQNTTFLGNTTLAWLTAILIIVAGLIAISVFKRFILRKLVQLSGRTATNIDDFILTLVEKSVLPALYIVVFYFATGSLIISPSVERVLHVAYLFVITFFVLRILTSLVKQLILSFVRSQENSETKEKQARGLLIIINVAIWIVGVVFLIDNLGYDVTTLITGLGIGGIAIALAAQTILGDLFSYFVIFFDRPFEIGDFIIVETKMGTVEYIGVKTTRIRTLSGEQLICSNTYLTNSQLHNYKRMEQRRVVFKIGVVYQTPHQQLKRIPEIVRAIIENMEDVKFDRGHFAGFGDSSLDFEFVYYVLSADYNIYMDKQQAIYFEVVEAFEAEKIDFAFPTRTVILQTETPEQKRQDVAS